MVFGNKIMPLVEKLIIKNNKNLLKIKLLLLKGMAFNFSHMFRNCPTLTKFYEVFQKTKSSLKKGIQKKFDERNIEKKESEKNTDNIYNEGLYENFFNISDIYTKSSVPIKKYIRTKKLSTFENISEDSIYSLILSLKKNSKEKIICLADLSYMFYECSMLTQLPDLSKFVTDNVEKMHGIFKGCKSLISLPDILNWNTKNVKNMSNILSGCSSLLYLPDISKWSLNEVIDIQYMFNECSSLLSLPGISKWKIKKVKYINNLFYNCSSLIHIPNITNWDANYVTDMSLLFGGCCSLIQLPNISKWDIRNPKTFLVYLIILAL